MADIFLSYTSSDRPRAEKLKAWFEEAGWSVWIDRDISLGEDWLATKARSGRGLNPYFSNFISRPIQKRSAIFLPQRV